jgi:hypothetical protein
MARIKQILFAGPFLTCQIVTSFAACTVNYSYISTCRSLHIRVIYWGGGAHFFICDLIGPCLRSGGYCGDRCSIRVGFLVNKVVLKEILPPVLRIPAPFTVAPLLRNHRPSMVCTVATVDRAVTRGQPESVSWIRIYKVKPLSGSLLTAVMSIIADKLKHTDCMWWRLTLCFWVCTLTVVGWRLFYVPCYNGSAVFNYCICFYFTSFEMGALLLLVSRKHWLRNM